MEKRRLSFFGILLMLLSVYASHIASAAEIVIGSKKYPSFILIPIVSIIVCSVILIGVLVNIARKRGNINKTRGRPFFSFGKPVREKKQENIYLKDIRKFKKDLGSVGTEEAFNMLSAITTNFFKELLDLHYEFTYNELEKELRKRNKRKEFVDICHEFSELKYSGKKITKEELGVFADKIQDLIRKEQVKKEESELKVSKALIKEKRGFLNKLSEVQVEKDKKKHLLELMGQEEDALKKDMEIAKSIYHKILTSYYKLPAKDRKDVYEKLTAFYEQVNKMLFSSFYSKESKKQLNYFTKQLSELQKQAEKVIAMEKIRAAQEKAAEKLLKAPELKVVEKPLKVDIKKERALKSEELKKLEMIEKEARERIKHIGENIIEQSMLQMPEKKEERTLIKEIKYVMPREYVAHKPVQKPGEVHAAHAGPMPPHEVPKEEHAPKHIEHMVKEIRHVEPVKHVPKPHALPEHAERHKHAEEKKHMEKYAGIKNRKIMHIAKEEREIRDKLERLGKNYIG